MSTLPKSQFAVVEENKITSYLLSDSHPAGRGKAAFFRSLGFQLSAWQTLRDALGAHARAGEVVQMFETEFGKKYIVKGSLIGPNGLRAALRSVWFITTGQEAPRLVTAYPLPGDEK